MIDFARLVRRMRQAQTWYFTAKRKGSGRVQDALRASFDSERVVDDALETALDCDLTRLVRRLRACQNRYFTARRSGPSRVVDQVWREVIDYERRVDAAVDLLLGEVGQRQTPSLF